MKSTFFLARKVKWNEQLAAVQVKMRHFLVIFKHCAPWKVTCHANSMLVEQLMKVLVCFNAKY